MACLLAQSLIRVSSSNCQSVRIIHLHPVRCMSVKWKRENNLTVNPNSFGPLTNLPDYSFKDGRPVPYGSNQKKRIDEQRQKLLRIKELADEIDYAVIKHKKLELEAAAKRQQILDRKLKEKGSKLNEENFEVKSLR